MKKVIETTVRIQGSGNTKEQALSVALGKIQNKIMTEYKGNMIIRIEPMNVNVIEAKESVYTERFLLFFFSRQRSKFNVVIDVDVNLFLLDVGEITFEKIEQGNDLKTHIMGNQFSK